MRTRRPRLSGKAFANGSDLSWSWSSTGFRNFRQFFCNKRRKIKERFGLHSAQSIPAMPYPVISRSLLFFVELG